jgi:hypothetical protein
MAVIHLNVISETAVIQTMEKEAKKVNIEQLGIFQISLS